MSPGTFNHCFHSLDIAIYLLICMNGSPSLAVLAVGLLHQIIMTCYKNSRLLLIRSTVILFFYSDYENGNM